MKNIIIILTSIVLFSCGRTVENHNKDVINQDDKEVAIEEWEMMYKHISAQNCITPERLSYWNKRAKESYDAPSDLKFVMKKFMSENSECVGNKLTNSEKQ